MRTIYLDHNIVHYFIKGFPASISESTERDALARILAHKECRFVVSDWNFLEPCRENDPKTGKQELVRRYGEFLLSLNPLYLPTVTAIKNAEMKQLVLGLLGLPHESAQEIVFSQTYSQARVVSGLSNVLLGYSLADFMAYLVAHQPELDQYKSIEAQILDAQRTMRRAKETGLDKDPAITDAIWRQWFASMMPERDLANRFIPLSERAQLLNTFVADPNIVLLSCPAIRAEDLLSEARARDTARTFKASDAIDLMHAVPVLEYCDVLVSNDGFVRECAKQVVKASGRRVLIVNTWSDAWQASYERSGERLQSGIARFHVVLGAGQRCIEWFLRLGNGSWSGAA